ncbi:MAG: GerAB/ArcD/ProY family transporter [Lawsonibacter sp.]|nr:GerAB/ArcD/ProY family transporter [Lawsonibacter sp.]
MGKDTISTTQLMVLVWAGVLAPAAEQLPGLLLPQAGRGAWLSVLAATPLVLAAGWLLRRAGGEVGLARGMTDRLGRTAGRGLLLLYMIWGELLLALRLRLSARRLLVLGWRDGALWFFLLGVAGMALWMGRGRLSAFARTGQLFLAALLAAAGVVLGLSLSQARLERLLPLSGPGVLSALSAALPAAGVLGWGLFAAFLADRTEKGGRGWHWGLWSVGGCLLLALAQAVILGNLGAVLAARLDNPFFALAKSVGVEGAFQRVEGIISSLWTFADLAMAGVLLFALRAMAGEFSPEGDGKRTAWAAGLLALVLAGLPIWERGTVGKWVPAGNLLLGLAVPALLALLPAPRKKR